MTTGQEIAARFETIRKRRGISQGELGRLSGLTGAAVSRIEAGRRSPSLDSVVALSEALGAKVTISKGKVKITAEPRAPRRKGGKV